MSRFRLIPLVWILGFAMYPNSALAQAADRSCTKVQQMALQSAIRRLSDSEQQRYSSKLSGYEAKMSDLYSRSEALENTVKSRVGAIQQSLLSTIIQSRQDLVTKAREALTQEKPDLAQRVRSGSPTAKDEWQKLVLQRIVEDPDFKAEYQKRLLQDSAYDSNTSQLLRMQFEQLHPLEGSQKRDTLRVPLPKQQYQQKTEEVAREFATKQGYSDAQVAGLAQKPAYQELLSTVAAAERARHTSLDALHMEFAASDSRAGWDTPGDTVAQAVDTVRASMRDLEQLRLRAQLNLHHIATYVPEKTERGALATSAGSKTSHVAAEAVAEAINGNLMVSEGYRRLDEIKVPPPNLQGEKNGETEIVDNAKKAVLRVKVILLGE